MNERFRKWLISEKAKATKNKNVELLFILDAILNKYLELEGNKVELILEGWKGEGQIDIYKDFNNDFVLTEYIKDKETSESNKVKHEVPKEDVNRIMRIIRMFQLGETYKCYDFAEPLGYDTWKDLWKERKQYFKYYYYPIKVLEKLKIIKYSGRGDITRLK